jgi:hypothetical protein
MKASEYLKTQAELAGALLRLRAVDRLDEFLDAAEHADAICPFLDPTLFKVAGRQLGEVIQMARAAKGLVEATAHLSAEWLEGLRRPPDEPLS